MYRPGGNASLQFSGMKSDFVSLAQANFVMPKLAVGDYPVQVTIGGAFPLGCLGSALLRKAAVRAHKGPEPRFNVSGANACAPERR